MPQGERTVPEADDFKRMLLHVNLLYLGATVYVIADMSYASRFWTQFEFVSRGPHLNQAPLDGLTLNLAAFSGWHCKSRLRKVLFPPQRQQIGAGLCAAFTMLPLSTRQ